MSASTSTFERLRAENARLREEMATANSVCAKATTKIGEIAAELEQARASRDSFASTVDDQALKLRNLHDDIDLVRSSKARRIIAAAAELAEAVEWKNEREGECVLCGTGDCTSHGGACSLAKFREAKGGSDDE